MLETNVREKQRALLAAVWTPGKPPGDLEASLDELAGLVDTAGGVVVAREIQHRVKPSGSLFIGRGKAQEIEERRAAGEFEIVVFDADLTPSQQKSIEDIINCPILDRTTVILDIFALRAKTREAKLQVEIAQLRHRLTRLSGKGVDLSRLAGGIGTRGPGLTKLEVDRRRIRDRIAFISGELRSIKSQREQMRKKRNTSSIPIIALAGYTNAGKSTLHNALSGSGTYADDRLFATLDVCARRIQPEAGEPYILIDTVGFIRNLPHPLVAAFRSTLEEIETCDIILQVVDSTSCQLEKEIQVVEEVLGDLQVLDRPRIIVFNKADRLASLEEIAVFQFQYPNSIILSAAQGWGIDRLNAAIQSEIRATREEMEFFVPFSKFSLLDIIHRAGVVKSREDESEGVRVKVILEPTVAARITKELGLERPD